MTKQKKIQTAALIVIGLAAVVVVAVFAAVDNHPAGSERVSGMSLDDIVKSRKTWNAAFTTWLGKAAPDLAVKDIEGTEHRLSDYYGRDVLVVFWATWCPACNMEIPHLIELRKMLGEDKLMILAISNETAEHLEQFVAAKGINYAVVPLGSSALPGPFSNVTSIPTTFFIDRNGTIKLAAEGLVSLEEAKAILQAE
jgi:peroxiredoxin